MRRAVLSLAICGAAILGLALSVSAPAGAQDGGPGAIDALATQAAIEAMATAQALNAGAAAGNAASQAAQLEAQAAAARAAAAQQAAAATRQAADMQARQAQAQATSQAAILQATLSAQATRSAIEATATQEAMNAAATAQAQSAQATAQAIHAAATSQALDAQATRAVYEIAIAQSQDQARLGQAMLYLAAALALGGVAYVVIVWARAAARKVVQPASGQAAAMVGDVVIDVTPAPLPALPMSATRMSRVKIINDPRVVAAAVRWFDGQDEDDNERAD